MAKTYHLGPPLNGFPAPVTVREDGRRDRPLNPRLDLENKSPDGFAWGYVGSGPAQLALAILADATGSDATARMLMQAFKWDVIGKKAQGQGHVLTEEAVKDWVAHAKVLHRNVLSNRGDTW